MTDRPFAYDLNHQPLNLASAEGEALAADYLGLRIGRDEGDGWTVSTIFLVVDYAFGEGAPLLYETATFGEHRALETKRWHTREEAVAGHAAAVARVKGT